MRRFNLLVQESVLLTVLGIEAETPVDALLLYEEAVKELRHRLLSGVVNEDLHLTRADGTPAQVVHMRDAQEMVWARTDDVTPRDTYTGHTRYTEQFVVQGHTYICIEQGKCPVEPDTA